MARPQTNLSFEGIRDEIKQFLKNQTKFKDYDFEGSNMAVILDVLAYNTYQHNFVTNLSLNETFLDSAQLRSSVVSHAKELNYLPRSMTSSRAVVDLFLSPTNSPSSVFMPANTKFTALCGNDTFTFYNSKAVTIIPNRGIYSYKGLEIYEGKQVTEFFSVVDNIKYIISNKNVDVSSIKVTLLADAFDTIGTAFTKKTSIFGVGEQDNIYYVGPSFEDKYEVSFGHNIFGIEPIINQIVKVEYRVPQGSVANNVNNFTTQNVSGIPVVVTTTSKSSGGADRESIEDIRYFAPKALQIQNRAVTENDYKILLKQNFPEVADVAVYGGDKANPPRFGKVIINVNQHNNNRMTSSDIENYTSFLKERSPLSIDPIITSPIFVYMYIDTKIKVDFSQTTKNISEIQSEVLQQIQTYATNNLDKFENPFLYSKLTSFIDAADVNIISNKTNTKMIIDYIPSINATNNIYTSFANTLKADLNLIDPAFSSSTFTYNGVSGYLRDNALGSIDIIRSGSSGTEFLVKNIGTIDYITGDVKIPKLVVSAFDGVAIKLYGNTDNDDVAAPLGRIFKVRDEDIKIQVKNSNE